MSLRNMIYYMENRGSSARDRSLRMTLYKDIAKHSSSQSSAMMFINQQFHYKALHGKVSIYYVDKRHRMLTLWTESFFVMVIL